MITVICSIAFFIKIGGVGWEVKEDVKGTVISESNVKYLVDFSKSKQAKDALNLDEPMLVDKDKCVKIK